MSPYRNDNTLPNHALGCHRSQLADDALGGLVEFQSSGEIHYSYPDAIRELANGGRSSLPDLDRNMVGGYADG